MYHGWEFSPGCVNDKLEAVDSKSSLSFTASLAKVKDNVVPDILKGESGEEREKTPLVLSCLRCCSSIAGLWVTFFFPLLLKLTSCASNIWFDRKNVGSLAS